MFKKLSIFQTTSELPDASALQAMLETCPYIPVGATQEKSIGFVPPRGQEHGALVESIGGHYMIRLAIETKSVPGPLLRKRADEKCVEIEHATGRKPGKKERRDLMDDILLEMLPNAFPKLNMIPVWIDPARHLIAIDSTSQGVLDTVISALINVWRGLSVSLIQTTVSAQSAMTQWLLAPNEDEWPSNFSIERECVLKSTGEDAASVRFSKHHLANPDVRKHVQEGKLPTQLAMSWDGKVAFVLTDCIHITKLQFLDGVMDAQGTDKQEDRFDADAALFTGLMGPLIDDLIEALGGKMEPVQAGSAAEARDEGGADTAAPPPFSGDGPDPLYDEAKKIVLTHQKASISLVQRHLRIGYNRAARLIEDMEAARVVSPMGSGGHRSIL